MSAVCGCQYSREGEEEDYRNAVQLESCFSQRNQDQWCLHGTQETRCIFLFQVIWSQMINEAPTLQMIDSSALFIRPGDPWAGASGRQDSDSFSSNTTEAPGLWQWRHGQGEGWNVLINFCIYLQQVRLIQQIVSSVVLQLLAELLRSKNPEDLQEANRLIKNMVKEVRHTGILTLHWSRAPRLGQSRPSLWRLCHHQDEVRVQKVTKRMHTLEEVNINVKLLTEMLSHYDKDNSSDSDKEIIKVCSRWHECTIKELTILTFKPGSGKTLNRDLKIILGGKNMYNHLRLRQEQHRSKQINVFVKNRNILRKNKPKYSMFLLFCFILY